ncbi:mechanosensitive ion channel family protein [Chitinasiproducens palmae]|uniref:Small-conductance mechanosensitive channel n=1 Tax=Chitinasiproducens palmae TaxID=1770053 RepID=A0A1H2PVU7_9BURK|nr:Small-conductance mechanosensitive channel [Chitinasiproducens palmae]
MKFLDYVNLATEAPLDNWLGVAALTLIVLLVGLGIHRAGSTLLRRLVRHRPLLGALVQSIDRPAQVALTVLVLQLVWQNASDDLAGITTLRRVSVLVLVGALTWLATRVTGAFAEAVIRLNPLDIDDNLSARALHTQTRVLARSITAVILIIGIGAMLMTLPNVRQIGTSLLASAGVAGLVAGIAARPVLGNLIAGLQIALSQPIRLDDVVVIQGEWGRVEDIAGSYVTVRIWDERRLIVPLQWLIENPFQNWTRSNSQLIGSVFLWLDYRIPLEPLRRELQRLCEQASEWDKRVQVLQVTDSNERAMQLRALVSSVNSSLNWDLRCKVREGLIAYVSRHYPEYLPRLRTEIPQLERVPEASAEFA